MMRTSLWAALLQATLPAAAQRAKVTSATVSTGVEGRVLSKKEYKTRLQTGSYAVDNAQVQGHSYTSLSLRKAATPDSARPQALVPEPTFGTPAPAFSGLDVNGRRASRFGCASGQSGSVAVNFWFVRCPYCIEEIPNFRQLTAAYRTSPDVVFVSFALDKAEVRRKFLAEHGGFGFVVLPEARETARQFGVSAYSVTAVIDRTGRFAYDQEYTDSTTRLSEAIGRALHP